MPVKINKKQKGWSDISLWDKYFFFFLFILLLGVGLLRERVAGKRVGPQALKELNIRKEIFSRAVVPSVVGGVIPFRYCAACRGTATSPLAGSG